MGNAVRPLWLWRAVNNNNKTNNNNKNNNNKNSRIAPTPKGMCLSTQRSGGGGAVQGHPNRSSSAKSTTATRPRGSNRNGPRPLTRHYCTM